MKKYSAAGVIVVIFTLYDPGFASITYEDTGFLANLTQNYDPSVRPVFNRSEKTTILIGMGLKSIISLDEKEEFISCNGWFSFAWTDQILQWNITEHTPPFIFVPVSKVWTPTVLLHNSVSDLTEILQGIGPVTVFNNGSVNYATFGRTDTRCKVNIQKFPFDQQVCYLQLSTYFDYISGEAADVFEKTVNLDLYDENGEFHLTEAIVYTKGVNIYGMPAEILEVSLTLKRRTTFYILNNILPVVFLSFLNSFAFLLPEDSGEKITFCISILLSYALYLTLINSYLPENSDNICFFSVYLTALVLISTVICLISIFILALHSRLQNGKYVPRCLRIRTSTTNQVKPIKTDGTEKEDERMVCNDDVISRWNSVAFGIFLTITISINGAFLLLTLF